MKPSLRLDDVLNAPQVVSTILRDDGLIPNSDLPLLVYVRAVRPEGHDLAVLFEEAFEANDWGGNWRDGIYTYHHYHSTTHEVLGVFKGSATVQLGGERGVKQKVNAGDVIIIPAGVAHKNLGASSDFGVVGGYPGGVEWDMNYGRPEERAQAGENLKRVTFPASDPLYGSNGPLLKHWAPK
ncbi:MAG TPA: cupin domain-containing protein [Candidatus Paceibacterota bacterium]|nr:cupin domain-containing protein [Candidatus Paceibacterota bacterium]